MKMSTSPFQRLAARPLQLLTRFGGAPLTDKLGLRKPAEQVLFHAAKTVVSAAAAVGNVRKADKPARLDAAPPTGVFDLHPTEDQKLIQSTARRFAEGVLRPAAPAADEEAAPPKSVLAKSTELGLAALIVPDAHGGVAESRAVVTQVLTAMELARGDLGLAWALLAPLAVVDALVRWGTAEQQARWLPRFTGEQFVPAALALVEPRAGFDPLRPQAGAVRDGDGWKLYGDKCLVPLAATAELFAIVVDVRGLGARIFLVERDTPGLTITAEPAMGLRAAATGRLHLDGARVGRDALLGGDDDSAFGRSHGGFASAPPAKPAGPHPDLAALIARSRILWGALGCGASQAVLDFVKGYVNERKAFGEPISHRQAVAFTVADMAIELQGMRLMVLRAAALADAGDGAPVERAAMLARMQVAAKAMKIGNDGVQMLGGHGYIKEFPVERWYRDLRAIGVMEGAL